MALGRAPQNGNVRIAELQVFGRAGGTGTTPPPAPQDPVVVLTTTGPLIASPGATVTYKVEYTNLGPAKASGATLTDTIPAGSTVVTASPGFSVSGGVVTWQLGDVMVGETGSKTVTVKVPSSATPGSVLVNTAEFTAPLTTATPAAATTLVAL